MPPTEVQELQPDQKQNRTENMQIDFSEKCETLAECRINRKHIAVDSVRVKVLIHFVRA